MKKTVLVTGAMMAAVSCFGSVAAQASVGSHSNVASVQTAKRTVKVVFPTVNEVKSVTIAEEGPVSRIHEAKDTNTILFQVLNWLHASKETMVKIPKSPSYRVNAAVGPSSLMMSTDSHTITIAPAFYTKLDANGKFTVVYIPNVISYYQSGETAPTYLHSPRLYAWLKLNHWKSEFK